MNWIQIGLSIGYVSAVFIAGVWMYGFFSIKNASILNKATYAGEIFLLGSIFIIGQMLILSLAHLYYAWVLWAMLAANFLFLLKADVRSVMSLFFKNNKKISLPGMLFIILIGIFVFRNSFFMIDVDSHSTYLYTQKLWLKYGTSLIGDIGYDIRTFVPQFNAVPYALGISLFGTETLFPQLINISWRLVSLVVVFGYVSYRFDSWTALASAMFMAFNDHFFYSGVNQFVVINGAVIAYLFAAAYSFWEARKQNDPMRFCLALVFALQLIANKYQLIYLFCIVIGIGLVIQKQPLSMLRMFLRKRALRWPLVITIGLVSFWYIKNLIVTADPFFPIFAGKLGVFGWTPELELVCMKVIGGLKPFKLLKYISYLFIWPGITVAKCVFMSIIFWPLIVMVAHIRNNLDKESIIEVCYWLSLSLFGLIAICLTNHQDPRYYRYLIAIFSVTTIVMAYFIGNHCLKVKRQHCISFLLVVFALSGYRIVGTWGAVHGRPTFKENIDVLFNRIHTDYAIDKYFSDVPAIIEAAKVESDKFSKAAWEFDGNPNMPSFFIPQRPIVSFWLTTVIQWDSYECQEDIVKDLENAGLVWVMRVRDGSLVFVGIDEYAKEAVKINRYPEQIFYDYNFPDELKKVTY